MMRETVLSQALKRSDHVFRFDGVLGHLIMARFEEASGQFEFVQAEIVICSGSKSPRM